MLKLLEEMKRCQQEKICGVIATIIRIEGSSYQKEGSKCFYSEDGNLTGILSGGCVEGDIIEHAKKVLTTKRPKKIYYDFRKENDQIWGLGVGCNGAIEIFLELFDPIDYSTQTKLMVKVYSSTKDMILATITHSDNKSEIGRKWIFSSNKEVMKNNEIGIHLKNNAVFLKGKSALLNFNNLEIFFDFVDPVPELFVFGAGPDAVPLVKTAKNIGWKVKVGDHRPGYLSTVNFPDADELVSYPNGVIPDILLTDNTYCVVMSHNFNQDQLVLEKLLISDVPYIGVLGPSKRTKQIIEPIINKYSTRNIRLKQLHSPVGLDIGAKMPEEIALSIAAELVNVQRDGYSRHLKDSKGEKFIDYCDEEERERSLPL